MRAFAPRKPTRAALVANEDFKKHTPRIDPSCNLIAILYFWTGQM
jgi:hypothetical protein